MAESNIHKALYQALETAALGYPIKYPNAPFTRPTNAPWLRVTVFGIGDETRTLGQNGYNERVGLVQVDVYAPKGAGDDELLAIVDSLRSVFKTGAKLTYNGLTLTLIRASTARGTPEQGWESRNVLADFRTHIQRA